MAIRYIVSDVNKAVKFYTEFLGFTIRKDWGPVVILTHGDIELWLSGPASSAGRTTLHGKKPTPGGSNRFVINVKHIQKTVEKLKQSDIQILSEIVKSPAGKWIVLSDPSGNPIELFETN